MAFIVVRVVRFYGCKSFKGLLVASRESEAEASEAAKNSLLPGTDRWQTRKRKRKRKQKRQKIHHFHAPTGGGHGSGSKKFTASRHSGR